MSGRTKEPSSQSFLVVDKMTSTVNPPLFCILVSAAVIMHLILVPGCALRLGSCLLSALPYLFTLRHCRVGAWRLLDMFRELKLPAAMLINTQLYNYCPELLEQARKDGHETVIHGRTNSEWQVTWPPIF